MADFWEEAFRDKQEMWGFQPANSALKAAGIFNEKGLKNIFIPGIGYGRNAQVFIFMDKGMEISGVEISNTAIKLAEKHYGKSIKIHHGSVTDLQYDIQAFYNYCLKKLVHYLLN